MYQYKVNNNKDDEMMKELINLTQTPEQLKYLTGLYDASRSQSAYAEWFIGLLLDRVNK